MAKRYVKITENDPPRATRIRCLDCADHVQLSALQRAGIVRLNGMTEAAGLMPRHRLACDLCGTTALLREA